MSIPPDIDERTIGPMIRDAIASDPAFRAQIERETARYRARRAALPWYRVYPSTPSVLVVLTICGLIFLAVVFGAALTFGIRP